MTDEKQLNDIPKCDFCYVEEDISGNNTQYICSNCLQKIPYKSMFSEGWEREYKCPECGAIVENWAWFCCKEALLNGLVKISWGRKLEKLKAMGYKIGQGGG